jgi:hypothetical protein
MLELDKDENHPMLQNIRKSLQKSNAYFAKKYAQREITKLWEKEMSSRALEMFQTGEGADCVIEVVHQHQQDGLANKQQEKKVFSFKFRLCNLHRNSLKI